MLGGQDLQRMHFQGPVRLREAHIIRHDKLEEHLLQRRASAELLMMLVLRSRCRARKVQNWTRRRTRI